MMKSCKNIRIEYSICLSVVLFFFVALFPFQTYAQHEDLLDKTWYLYKLEIDGEEYEYYALDILSDNDESRIEISDNFSDEFTTSILFDGCPGWGLLLYIKFIENESKFILEDGMALPFEHCLYRYYYDDYAIIEDYFHSFYEYGLIVEYSFETIDSIEYLIFTNENNDKLYYTAENLSTPDFEMTTFTISPNPAQDQLSIRLDDLSPNTTLEIYDIHGRLLDNLKMNEIEIQLDVSDYASGMYFIQIKGESSNTQIARFLKQ